MMLIIRSALFRMETRLPHAIVAARKPDISISSFSEKRCGMLTGSDPINSGLFQIHARENLSAPYGLVVCASL